MAWIWITAATRAVYQSWLPTTDRSHKYSFVTQTLFERANTSKNSKVFCFQHMKWFCIVSTKIDPHQQNEILYQQYDQFCEYSFIWMAKKSILRQICNLLNLKYWSWKLHNWGQISTSLLCNFQVRQVCESKLKWSSFFYYW